MSGPLRGLRVLDLSRVLAGPLCTQLLADLGAEVIKVERPLTGDDTRSWGPPFAGSESAYFLSLNRGKRSVVLDLARPRGAELARRLADRSDVVVENFRPGVLQRFGLDHASLSATNPRVVTCSITGFGAEGTNASKPGYDALIQAMGGLMSITGEPDGGPVKVGVAIADVLTGQYALIAIQAALLERERTGEGRRVEVALLDSMAASLVNQAQSYFVTGEVPGKLGSAHPNLVPYQSFEARDGWFTLATGTDAQFAATVEIIGAPELAPDPRFRTNADRVTHRRELIDVLSAAFARQPVSHWVAAFERRGVPAGPIRNLAEVFEDPALGARGFVRELDHPAAGRLRYCTSPIRVDGEVAASDLPPPVLGQHTREVMRSELGIDDAEFDQLARDGAFGP